MADKIQSYHDRCFCGELWVNPDEGVRILSDESVMCRCGQTAIVSRLYIRRLKTAGKELDGILSQV